MMESGKKTKKLVNEGKKRLHRLLFSRFLVIVCLMLLQILILAVIYGWLRDYLPHFTAAQAVFDTAMIIWLFNSDMDSSAKLTWLMLITLFPLPGAFFLFYSHTEIGHRAIKARIAQLVRETHDAIPQDPAVIDTLSHGHSGTIDLREYLNRSGCFPLFDATGARYFPSGEAKFHAMLTALKRAKKFIFLEYFIVEEGYMWGRILDILIRKAKAGVEVRVMYDGMCELSLLPHDYPERLRAHGIQAKAFSPLTPIVSTYYNYRDHRKILVIDGETAFTGGVNLADEYINRKERFGHWKDTAVMVHGQAAKSFTLMFLQMWNIDEPEPEFQKYLDPETLPVQDEGQPVAVKTAITQTIPDESAVVESVPDESAADDMDDTNDIHVVTDDDADEDNTPLPEPAGFVMPYCDCPLDGHRVGENVYIDMLYRAERYVHIMTPYLILDDELLRALRFAAQRGVDVKMILPGIPDKKYAYALAKSHYAALTRAGIRIFEYTPGFVHAKVFVSDDVKAVVGTINLDYRSLYHHFECAAYLYRTPCVADIEADFQKTLSECRAVTLQTIRKEKLSYQLMGSVLKLVAPLM